MHPDTLNLLRTQRSVHWDFADRPVRREDIDTIVQCALHTANNSDRMDLSIVLVEDAQVLDRITGGDSGGRAVPTLVFLLDYSRALACARQLGYPDWRPQGRLYQFLYEMFDVNGAAQSAVIAARALGLATLVTNFAQRQQDPAVIREALHLPDQYCFPVIQVALGYAKEALTPRPDYPLRQALHEGTYRPVSDADVDAVVAYMDETYPECISEAHPHALNWYYEKWWIEHYDGAMYTAQARVLRDSGLLTEPGLCPEG